MGSREKRNVSLLEANITAPIYPLHKEDLKCLQTLLKKHSVNINVHPLVILRPEENITMPEFKPNAGEATLSVRKMTCDGSLSKKVCTTLAEEEVEQNVKFSDYKQLSESEGECTKEDLDKILRGKKFKFDYGDHNEKPESFVDMTRSSIKWNWVEENGLKELGSVPGVNTEFIYFGSRGSFFAWHNEDGDLLSINIHLAGKPKLWYAVHKRDYQKVLSLLEKTNEYKDCKVFWRHKRHILNLKRLRELNVTVYEHLQLPGDIVITNGFHQGGNLGFNVNVAINVAIEGESWSYSCIKEAEKTSCDSKCRYDEKAVYIQDLKPDYIVCNICPKVKKFYSDLGKRKHDQKCHGGFRNSLCRYCGKSFIFVLKHEKTEHKKELKEVRCKLCLKLFQNTWERRQHWKDHKTDEKGYRECKFCKKRFRLMDEAHYHICVKK